MNELTKREYFAACAMQGLLAKHSFPTASQAAFLAVNNADALIKALKEMLDNE